MGPQTLAQYTETMAIWLRVRTCPVAVCPGCVVIVCVACAGAAAARPTLSSAMQAALSTRNDELRPTVCSAYIAKTPTKSSGTAKWNVRHSAAREYAGLDASSPPTLSSSVAAPRRGRNCVEHDRVHSHARPLSARSRAKLCVTRSVVRVRLRALRRTRAHAVARHAARARA